MYTHPTKSLPNGIAGLPGDIFANAWDEDAKHYYMGLFEWYDFQEGTQHPEEPDFVYNMDPKHLENEGWFHQKTEEH